MRLSALTSALCVTMLASMAHAQQPGPAASAGPGKIVCRTKTTCVLGIGDPAKIKYQINADALPDADKDRLSKQCTATGKTPCIVTVQGTEMGDPLKVKAVRITWYN